jgi:hypothetical protein
MIWLCSTIRLADIRARFATRNDINRKSRAMARVAPDSPDQVALSWRRERVVLAFCRGLDYGRCRSEVAWPAGVRARRLALRW